MDYRRNNDYLIIRLDESEEIVKGIKSVCEKESIQSGVILSVVGAMKRCELVFKPGCRQHFEEHFEVSGNGNISMMNNEIMVHLHVVAGNDLNIKTGHLLQGVVTIFCEIVLLKLNGLRMVRTLDTSLDPELVPFPYKLSP